MILRYIHQNPVKAGVVDNAADWKWSSCQGYYGGKSYLPGLLDSDLILGIFSEHKILDDTIRTRLTEEEARAEIKKLIPELEIPEVKSLPKAQRDEIILKIKTIEGLT